MIKHCYKPKISIIMPFRNCAKTLRKSISSCLNQSLKDIELIVLNDCSDDDGACIVKELASLDSRLVFINNTERLGIFASRNLGLLSARSELVMFVDADDILCEKACEICFNVALEFSDVDLFCFEAFVQRSKKKLFYKIKQDKIYERDEFLNFLSRQKHFYHSVWAKLFRKKNALKALSCVNMNENLNYAEDLLFYYLNLICANKIFCSKEVIYTYCFNENGVFNSNDESILNENIKHKAKVLDIFKKNSKKDRTAFSKLLLFIQMQDLKDLKFRLKKIQKRLSFLDKFLLKLRRKRRKRILRTYKKK